MFALTMLAVVILAQSDVPLPSPGWTIDSVAKVGLGVASFVAFVGGSGYLVRFLLQELKDSRAKFAEELSASRAQFLQALEKQHVDHAREVEDLRVYWEGRDEKLREKIHRISDVVQGAVTTIERDHRERSTR